MQPSLPSRKTAPSSCGANACCGGNCDKVKSELSGGAERVVGKGCAFAAVKEDGSVVTWESQYHGRNSNKVKSGLQGGVEHVIGNCLALPH